jgi:hypothetical protein
MIKQGLKSAFAPLRFKFNNSKLFGTLQGWLNDCGCTTSKLTSTFCSVINWLSHCYDIILVKFYPSNTVHYVHVYKNGNIGIGSAAIGNRAGHTVVKHETAGIIRYFHI